MQQPNALAELNVLLEKSVVDDSAWAEYDYEEGEVLLAKLDSHDRAALFLSVRAKPVNWRRCFVSILHPSKPDEGEALVGALHDGDEEVVYEALSRLYFFCGFIDSARKGVFQDGRRQIASLWERVRQDQDVLLRMQELSQARRYYAAYWYLLAEAAAPGQNLHE